jgi:zona occludens toxin (predicted ATPase)
MIKVIQGKIGSGKTSRALDLIFEELHTGHRKVYTNIPHYDGPDFIHHYNHYTEAFHPQELEDYLSKIMFLPKSGKEVFALLNTIPYIQDSLIVIDEAQIVFDRRKNDSDFISWLARFRSDHKVFYSDSIVLLITQNSKSLDSSILDLVEETLVAQKFNSSLTCCDN